MEEERRDPREDISYIRHILEKTADGMKSVAPWFMGFGLVWQVYGLLCAVLRVVQGLVALAAAMLLANTGAILGWLFYFGLAVGFIVVRRKQKQNGLTHLALKLMDIWGVCILVFLLLSVSLVIISILAVRGMELTRETAESVRYTLSVCRSFLLFLLPIAPLLMTALFLENRRMLWMGAALAVLGLLVIGCNMLLMYAGSLAVGPGLAMGSTAAACLLDLIPGVMLLLFARQLKRS